MLVQILIAILFGLIAGTITGLIPGIHINLISILILSSAPILLNHFSLLQLCTFILAMSITHTFIDSIPSIYLGAPDESQILSALPGHKMLIAGNGHEAVLLTIIGSLLTSLLSILLFFLFTKTMAILYTIIKNHTGYILIIIITIIFLINKDPKKIIKSIIIFMVSGILGIIILNLPNLKQPLFHLLSGLFGTSILLLSIEENTNIPNQNKNETIDIETHEIKSATFSASIAGFVSAFMPGFGASQAAILASAFLKNISEKGFLILTGGLNSASMIISICSFFILEKARNGSILVIKEFIPTLPFSFLILFLLTSITVSGFASIIAMKLSKLFSKLMSKINYKATIITVISFITILSFIFDNYIGLLILITSTSLGIITTKLKVGKNNLMGCLILNVIIFFITQ